MIAYLTSFDAGDADFNGDGTTGSLDFFEFLAEFLNGCPPTSMLSDGRGSAGLSPRFDNPCVPDVVDQFLTLNRHADTSGFYAGMFSGDTECPGRGPFGSGDCRCISHYQGIVRGPGPGVPHLYVSKNQDPEVLVVRMGSRDSDGERLRSNRLVPNVTTEFTWPHAYDGEVNSVQFPDLNAADLEHAGGMQVIGDTLAVPFECETGPFNDCFDQSFQGAVALLDLSNPAFPHRYFTQFFPHFNGGNAIARLPDDGRYLLLIAGEGGPSLVAYVSNVTDLHHPSLCFQYVGAWSDRSFGYQHFSIVKQCDGNLYVVGTLNVHPQDDCSNPLNRADLWSLKTHIDANCRGSFCLRRLHSIDLACVNLGAGVACDFQAAAGTYVSPSGELIIYGTVHQQGEFFTPFAEFRRRDTVHPTAQPWVQLYSMRSGWESASGQSLVFDMPDRYKDNFLNFGLTDLFDNTASSVRWWAPAGCSIELIANPCVVGNTGTVLRLHGSGGVESIRSLATTAMGEKRVSAIRFGFDATQPYGCFQNIVSPSEPCRVAGPDLIVTHIDAASSIWGGCTTDVGVTIRNIGEFDASGAVNLGIWLSLDGNPFDGDLNDIPMGGPTTCVDVSLPPGESTTAWFTSLPVPENALPGRQFLVACIDTGVPPCARVIEMDETNNCASAEVDVAVVPADVGIIDLDYPSPVTSGDLVPITVSVRNFGCNRVCDTLTACIGVGQGSNCAPQFFCVDPFGSEQVTINVLAPLSEPDCGLIDNFSVSARLDFVDENNSNNCRSETIGIVDTYYDLRVSLSNTPNSTCRNRNITWTVTVRNNGNMASPANFVHVLSGIAPNGACGNWNNHLGQNNRTLPSIAPNGGTFSYSVGSYCIPFIPFCPSQQYIKAEICNVGCGPAGDPCTSGNCAVPHEIDINCCAGGGCQ